MKIQLKRSSVLDGGVAKAPEAAQMEFGELAINYNAADPAIFVKDSAGNIVKSDLSFDSSEFVKTIGDNMTGNLTLGTTNIILDAISGAAAFTGLVTVGDNKVSLTNTGNGTFKGTLTATALSDGTVTKDMTDVLGGSGSGGAQVFVSENPPQAADLEEGTLWWNSSDTSAQLFILYTDPVSGAGDVGGKMWIQASPPGFIDGNVYLPLSGGNMVGDVTFNTNKITLFASDGSARFGTDDIDTSAGVSIFGEGSVSCRNDTSSAIAFQTFTGGAAPSNRTSSILADGSAEFAGEVNIGDRNPSSTTNVGTRIAIDGSVSGVYAQALPSVGSSANAFQALSGNNEVFKVAYDGSAIFNNYVQSPKFFAPAADANDYTFQSQLNNKVTLITKGDGTLYIGDDITLSTGVGATIALNNDGSAMFAGDVQVGGNPYTETGVDIRSIGLVKAARTGADSVWAGYTTGNSSATSEIFADGSATFASGAATIAATGSLNVNRTVETNDVISGSLNGSLTSTIKADGSATFAGAILSQNTSVTPTFTYINSGGFYTNSDATTQTVGITASSGNATFAGGIRSNGGTNTIPAIIGWSSQNIGAKLFQGINGGNAIVFEVLSEGSAMFAGALNCDKSVWGNKTKLDAIGILGYANGTSNNYAAIQGQNFQNGFTFFGQDSGGNTTFSVKADGTAGFSGTVTATVVPPSDARFKQNITPAKPQLADVVALGNILKNFDWNDQAPLNEEIRAVRQLGLIAQEAEAVCPSIVKDIYRTKQGAELTAAVVDSEGVETKAATYEELDDSYKGISQDALIMKLIGAVAELSAEVTALKAGS